MSEKFFNEMNQVFEEILSDKKQIIVVEVKTNKTVELDYTRMLFDCNLNMFKVNKETGAVVAFKNPNFKAILVN